MFFRIMVSGIMPMGTYIIRNNNKKDFNHFTEFIKNNNYKLLFKYILKNEAMRNQTDSQFWTLV